MQYYYVHGEMTHESFDIKVFTSLLCFSGQTVSIYKFGLSVCLYPINVKTAEPIGPKFFVGHLGTPGKVYELSLIHI